MHTLFSTEGMIEDHSFRLWRELIFERIGPVEQKHVGDGPFEGRIEYADVDSLRISRISESSLETRVTPNTLRRRSGNETVFVLMQLAGESVSAQDDRDVIQRAGDIVVLGGRPNIHSSIQKNQSLVVELPRERLENLMGPTKLYTAMNIDSKLSSSKLTMNFFKNLVEISERIDPFIASRMSKIGSDLIIASIAEKLAQDVPKSLQGTISLQRAKAYIEANFSDPSFDPRQLAASMGTSLRRLQELFQEHEGSISDFIWERRLQAAALRLRDHACNHLAIHTIAYNCGFSHPPHFSRRFRTRFGMTPSEFRRISKIGFSLTH